MFSTEARGYRVTVTITDKRDKRNPLQLAHTVEIPAYDAADAIIQAGFELKRQGLFDPDDDTFGLRIANVQPALPPYSTLTGAAKGPLDERIARFLNSRGF